MKIRITLFLFILHLSFQQTFSQSEIVGSDEFGRIYDLTYDAKKLNTIYAITSENHIVISEDNGSSWSILYSLYHLKGATIQDMKLSADGSALTFAIYKGNDTNNAILVYDLESKTVIKLFDLPNQADLAYVASYDFYDKNMDILLLDTNYAVGYQKKGKTFYTNDGGKSWEIIYFTDDYDTVFIAEVAISPNNPEKIFLTRDNGSTDIDGGIFVSDDAGKTYTEKLKGIVLAPIAFDPSDDQTIFIGTGIGFNNTVENLYKSTDGGDTFKIVSIKWTEGVLNNINVIKFNKNNPSQIIVLEENEIAISEDGGTSFKNIVYAEESSETYYFGLNASYNPYNNQEVIISSNYFPFFSSDGGFKLSKIYTPYFKSTGSIGVFKNKENTNLYYGVQQGIIHRDLKTGKNTSHDIIPLHYYSTNSSSPFFIDQITPNRMYSLSSGFTGKSLKVSNDHGATNSQLLSMYTNKLTAVATYSKNTETILAAFAGYEPSETILKKIDFTDINKVVETDIKLPTLDYVLGIIIEDSGKIILSIGTEIYSSIDDGATWENNSRGLDSLTKEDLIFGLSQDPFNINNIAIATSKGIFISDDNGKTWVQKTKTFVNKIAFSTENSGVLIAATYNSLYNSFTLYYSVNNGDTWEKIDNDNLLSVSSYSSDFLFEDKSITTYIGTTDLGLLKYTIDLNGLSTPDIQNNLNSMIVYPNPAKNNLNIKLKQSNITNVAVFSLTGTKVLEFKNKNTIDISSLASGIYSLRVKGDNNDVTFKRFIKQ